MNKFERYLRNTRPACLEGFKVKKSRFTDYEEEEDKEISVWQLACQCGSTEGRFLGYLLKDYNKKYDGPDFVSPLQFECSKCDAITLLFDTDLHGYSSDIDRREGKEGVGSCLIRGKGKPKEYLCPKCQKNLFKVKVGFVFWQLSELEDEFEDRWEDLFMFFICKCKCVGCGDISDPTGFGRL